MKTLIKLLYPLFLGLRILVVINLSKLNQLGASKPPQRYARSRARCSIRKATELRRTRRQGCAVALKA